MISVRSEKRAFRPVFDSIQVSKGAKANEKKNFRVAQATKLFVTFNPS